MHFLLLKHFGQRYKNLTRILFQVTLIQNGWQAKKQLVFARHNRTHRPTGAGIYWQHLNSRGNAFTASFHREVASPYWNSASHYWKKHSAFFLVPATSLDKNQQFGPKRPVGQAVTRSVSGEGAEASLRMVAPGRDFVVSPSIGQNIAEDQKKKSSLENELVFSPKVCDDQKKDLCLSIFLRSCVAWAQWHRDEPNKLVKRFGVYNEYNERFNFDLLWA